LEPRQAHQPEAQLPDFLTKVTHAHSPLSHTTQIPFHEHGSALRTPTMIATTYPNRHWWQK
ncbi:MAG: hypothetical protein IJF97_04050, partial [Eggerthellaceae bacterium]|nr:hypothetical protein [Eggerthellaceae bacterium]